MNIVFPIQRLWALKREGMIGEIAGKHYGFMGHITVRLDEVLHQIRYLYERAKMVPALHEDEWPRGFGVGRGSSLRVGANFRPNKVDYVSPFLHAPRYRPSENKENQSKDKIPRVCD
jgi:hypothetical protein